MRGLIDRMPRRLLQRNSGAALVILLVFIILITIVLVAFVTTSSLERKTVESHYARVQADLYSKMGVDVIASRLTLAGNLTGSWWISQPGRIAYGPITSETSTNSFIDLSSGKASIPIDPGAAVNLNPAALTQPRGIIASDKNFTLPVKWIYVRADGSQASFDVSPPYSASASPFVGRYAFWADDESSRINLNVATSSIAPAAEPVSHPSRAELSVLDPLTEADINSLRSHRESKLFDSLEHVKVAEDSLTLREAVDTHKADLTHYSHSPELNVFNEAKIVLTTRKELAGDAPFFDILKSQGLDPGVNTNIDAVKLNALFLKLYGYLKRKDWPMLVGKSYVDKYGKENAAQLVLNLIDYVRSAEATNVVVEATRGGFDASAENFPVGSVAGASGMMGNARRILITQMGVWISDTIDPTTTFFGCRFRVEVFLPESAGDATTTVNLLEGDRELFTEIVGVGPDFYDKGPTNLKIKDNGAIQGGSGSQAQRAKLSPGQYRTVTMSYALEGLKTNPRPTGPVYLRAAIRVPNSQTVAADISPLFTDQSTASQALYNIDPPGKTFDQITAIFANDPVINKSRFDWLYQGPNTFGTSTTTTSGASTLGTAAISLTPQQDTDNDGKLTDVGFGFPAVKGSTKNPLGLVQSVGELGRIHTGGKGTSLAGVPWRTLRLQPRLPSDESLPDWALIDLFTVTKKARGLQLEAEIDTALERMNAATRQPYSTAVGGLINVNARMYPFSETTPSLQRTAPLRAILQNTSSPMSEALAITAANNILDYVLADGDNKGTPYGPSTLQSAKLYLTPAQLAEVKGVADGGEASEGNLQMMLPFLTDRGSVYSVFSVGQKITQLKDGRIKVFGESRTHTLLERQKDGRVRTLRSSEIGTW